MIQNPITLASEISQHTERALLNGLVGLHVAFDTVNLHFLPINRFVRFKEVLNFLDVCLFTSVRS
jgi:hypothetical protein